MSFTGLIAEELEHFRTVLSEKSEELAAEREKALKEEINRLHEVNADLRSRLPANDLFEPKFVQTASSPSGQACIQDLAIPSNECDVPHRSASTRTLCDETTSGSGPFFLLPELLQDDAYAVENWDGVDYNGSFVDREHPPSGIEKHCGIKPHSTLKLCWDILGIPILAWDLITIPMGVFALGDMGATIIDVAGWITMMYWSIDMPITFLTGFHDNDGDLVMDLAQIRRRYLHGTFLLDLLIVSGDWIGLVIELIGTSVPGSVSSLGILRALRIMRFVRLMRLRKLKSKIQTVEDRIDNEWVLAMMNMTAKVLHILIINHYVACVWFALGNWGDIESAPYRWLSSVPYPQYDYKDLGWKRVSDADWVYQYFTSLHWALAQITPGPQNIQPQNWLERLFVVIVLLFGMCLFSSFIASVTQARMQLNKMMSKFERDNWVLRKFCRQHNISRGLQTHMRRYVDLVIIPNYHKLSVADVVLFPKLSAHLRAQLNTELMGQHLTVHPFFKKLQVSNENVMHYICNNAAENVSYACGDVAFVGGVVAHSMLYVTGGVLDYIPMKQSKNGPMQHDELPKGHWCCEAVLWTKWTHQGQLQASIESTAVCINGKKFRLGLQENGLILSFVRAYGISFCEELSNLCGHKWTIPSDLHEQVTLKIDMNPKTMVR